MNPLIQKCIDQSNIAQMSSGTGMGNAVYMENEKEVLRFAQLLLEECTKLCTPEDALKIKKAFQIHST